jgi:opacity protein-like surface antigen
LSLIRSVITRAAVTVSTLLVLLSVSAVAQDGGSEISRDRIFHHVVAQDGGSEISRDRIFHHVVAQDGRSEISVQATGLFTKDSDNNGIQNQATQSGGFLVGYRHGLNRWLAAEANYGYSRNTQIYTTGLASARVQSNVHEITGAAVVKLPQFARVQPFVLSGGGILVFDPTNNAGTSLVGASRQPRGTFLYGAGVDYSLMTHLALRGEYRGFVYQVPDFDVSRLNPDSWTHVAQPSAGIVFRF